MKREAQDTENIEAQAAVFKALADPTRLKLVRHLCHQQGPNPLCVNALAERLGISQSAVSQHLRVLKSIGLVSGARQGCCIHYGIDHDELIRCHEIILAALNRDAPAGEPCDADCCNHE